MKDDFKSSQSGLAAKLCLDAGYYDVAIARSYYWVFQHLLFWAQIEVQKELLEAKVAFFSNHRDLANAMVKNLGRRNLGINSVSISKQITQLRNARHIADYKPSVATKHEAEELYHLASEIIKLIQIYFVLPFAHGNISSSVLKGICS